MADSLLDFLQQPDAQLGLALLAAGGPTSRPMGVGERIFGALQSVQGQQDAAMKRQLLKSQIDENASQNKLREGQLARQARQDAYFLGDPSAASAAPAASGGAALTSGGAPALPGAALKAAIGAPAGASNPSEGKFDELSRNFGIPKDALVADYFTNGGKGIADMLMKRGTPDIQVINGYAYDKNRVQPGFLPALNTSQDGKSTMTLVDPNTGLPRVLATPGAVDAFAAFQGVQDRSRAAYTPGRPVIMEGGRMGGQSQLQEITGTPAPGGAPAGYATEPQMRTTAQGDMGGTVDQYRKDIADIQASLKQPLDVGSRRLLEGQLQQRQQQLARYFPQAGAQPAAPAGVQGGGLEFSPTEKAQQEAERTRQVDTAKADVVRDTDTQKKAKSAGAMIAAADRAIELLKQGPTASGLGEMVDKGANFFGKSTKGAQVASQLDIVSGDLVNNVPRMEGPQSDGDRLEYKTQAGRAADRSLPVDQRLAAMQEVKRLQTKYAPLNGGLGAPAVPASDASSLAPAAPKSFKDAGYGSAAQAIQDAQNTILRNPKARPEVERRLKSIGLALPGATGSW